MGVYQFRCDEERAECLWDQWLASGPRRVGTNTAVPSFAIGPESRVDDYIECSIRFSPTKPHRIRTVGALALVLAASQLIVTNIEELGLLLARFDSSALRSSGIILLAAVVGASVVFPLIFLLRKSSRLVADEDTFISLVERSGVDVRPLAKPIPAALFPGEAFVILYAVVVTLGIELFVWVDSWELVRTMGSLLLLMTFAVPQAAMGAFAHSTYERSLDPYGFWRLQASFAVPVFGLFFLLVMFYWGLSVLFQVNTFLYSEYEIESFWGVVRDALTYDL